MTERVVSVIKVLPKWVFAISPSFLVLLITLVISLVIDASEGLFLAPAREHIPLRFLLITSILLAPILILHRLLAFVKYAAEKQRTLVQLAIVNLDQSPNMGKVVGWVIRPLQGIGLSMIFAQRLLNLFEYSGTSVDILLRPFLFILSSMLVSILLCVVWALDDLGVRIYSSKSGEVRMAGNGVGTVLPVVFGALGVYNLFQSSSFISALITVVEIAMVLYPPFSILSTVHHQYVKSHGKMLGEVLAPRRIWTSVE
ncbi:MAG: hypothetical protein HYY67_07430 [Thaumarchaeota archaeon]|nr:hypothetical protein [Nitrososphaerota archaeon]